MGKQLEGAGSNANRPKASQSHGQPRNPPAGERLPESKGASGNGNKPPSRPPADMRQ